MTTAASTSGDTLVLDYLAALWAAGEDLPPEVRDELMNTVAGYITARRDLAAEPERVLGLLGPPEQLVAAVRRSGTPTHLRLPQGASMPDPGSGPGGPVVSAPASPLAASSPAASSLAASSSAAPAPAGGSERAAVALLLGGAFVLPGPAQAAAMLIVSRSPAWGHTEKTAAWLLAAGPVTGLFLMMMVLFNVSLLSGVSLLALYMALTAGSVAAGLTLRRSL